MTKQILTIITLLSLMLAHAAQPASAHQKKRLTVALVLGGGGAKGAAEVGVLKEIEAVGMPVDYIVGTSIGSIVGGLYAAGYRSAALDSLFTHQDWLALFNDRKAQHGEKVKAIGGFGLMRGTHVMEFLDSLLTAKDHYTAAGNYPDSILFDSLPIPFRAVACNVKTGESAVLSQGSLPLAMRASMAIPGVFKPVRIDSLTMLDGGLVNNLPVDVARSLGADIVIAVDLTQNKHPDFVPKKIMKHMGKELKWLRQRPDFVNYNRNRKDADLCINPTLKGYGVTSFRPADIRSMIDLGHKAAQSYHSQLVALRKKATGEQ